MSLVENAELEKWDDRWMVRIAELVANAKLHSTNVGRSEAVILTKSRDFQAEPLVSWIIAPKAPNRI